MNIAINVFYIFPVLLALCLMLLLTHYAQNYTDIIGGSLMECSYDLYNCIVQYMNPVLFYTYFKLDKYNRAINDL